MSALIICWVFWTIVISLMIYWRRAWGMLLALPLILSVVLWLLNQWSPRLAFWVSISFHTMLLFIIFNAAIFGRRDGDDSMPDEDAEDSPRDE